MVSTKLRHSERVSFIMRKGKHMKLTEGIYQTNRVLMLRSHFSEENIQAMTLEFIYIKKGIRGGYLGYIKNGDSKYEVIIKNDQASALVKIGNTI